MCINDLAAGVKCNDKPFADDTSLLTFVEDTNSSASDDLEYFRGRNFREQKVSREEKTAKLRA